MFYKMKLNNLSAVLIALSIASSSAVAEMKAMTDDFLSGVSGQSGLTIDA